MSIFLAALALNACTKNDDIDKKLNAIMSIQTIGVQKDYFDKTYGPAKRVLYDSTRQYEIGECRINIKYDSNNAIKSIELQNISKKCSFDAKNIYLDGQAYQLTYNDLILHSMRWQAMLSCYSLCGNAADPTYGIYVETPHVTQFIEYEASSDYSIASKASNQVADYFKEKFPSYEMNGGELGPINNSEYNNIWIQKFKDIGLTSLKFGYQLNSQ
jgi:hypothetical protein